MDDSCKINDYRKVSEFSKKSFSDYNKKDIIKVFLNNLILSKLHDSCYIGAEMHISLYNNLILETLFNIGSANINIDYPTLPNILYTNLLKYQNTYKSTEDNRNNQEIRNIFTYLIAIITTAPKNSNFQIELVTKLDELEFELFMLEKNIKFTNLELVSKLFFPDENKELIIVINEIANLLRLKSDNTKDILYWVSWLIGYEKKYKDAIAIRPRKIDKITPKNTRFWEWIVWSVFINEAYYRNEPILYEQIFSLYNLYKFNFKKSSKKKYLIFIYHAIYIFKKDVNWDKNPSKENKMFILQASIANNKYYSLIFNKNEDKFFLEEKPEEPTKAPKSMVSIKPKKQSKKEIEENEIKKRMSYLYI